MRKDGLAEMAAPGQPVTRRRVLAAQGALGVAEQAIDLYPRQQLRLVVKQELGVELNP
jgi:hypothetical protein